MKYCSRCGTELVDEAVVCTKCGCAVGTAGQIVAGGSGVGQKFIVGLVILVLGVVGLIYSLLQMTSGGFGTKKVYRGGSMFDADFRLAPSVSVFEPSGNEIVIIVVFLISIIAAIVGAIKLKSGMIKKPKKVVRIPVWLWLLRLGLLIGVGVFGLSVYPTDYDN